ncbi:ATP-binding cassette domain-containing protein [Streptomyces sp. NPDC056517]|uniref:ATP-binding cassette domain-containing protein n=1 Tax=unclassified Streptomyces TaxID=2593676 RepID=UPI0036A8129B
MSSNATDRPRSDWPATLTGLLLGLAGAAGETAPLIFTATVFLGAPTLPTGATTMDNKVDRTVISVRDLQILDGTKRLVGPVTFELAAGSTTGLCGPSGAGKSTVLHTLVDLLPHGLRRQGEVEVLGRPVRHGKGDAGLRSTVVLVPQTPVVFCGSILDNALFDLRHPVRASHKRPGRAEPRHGRGVRGGPAGQSDGPARLARPRAAGTPPDPRSGSRGGRRPRSACGAAATVA